MKAYKPSKQNKKYTKILFIMITTKTKNKTGNLRINKTKIIQTKQNVTRSL